jgi:hypothetical protein
MLRTARLRAAIGRKFLLYSSEVMAYARTAQKPAHDAAMANVQRLRALIG